ncbi:MAG: adenosine deaminase [marine bacterium B5-7]|nr:MAG: adenosine deaminase [marine bacterium B5-7]
MRRCLLLLGIGLCCHSWATNATQTTAQYFASIQHDPNAVLAFIQRMPKGGELHDHLDGAAYAEHVLHNANHDPICISSSTLIPEDNTACPKGWRLDQLEHYPAHYNAVIDAWSLRHFTATATQSMQDHFFATFPRFAPVFYKHLGANLASVVKRAAAQHEQYLELIFATQWPAAAELAKQIPWQNNFATMRKKLLKAGIPALAKQVSIDTNNMLAEKNALLACSSKDPQAACRIKVKFLYFAFRMIDPAQTFAQLLLGFEVAHHDPHFVGINLVGPEADVHSVKYYHQQMQMIGYLHSVYPDVHISLHAGELAPEEVPPQVHSFHIADAIKTAHAERIGHGVDIASEKNADTLVKRMAEQPVPVEICLTSNADLLGVHGKQHPLPYYLANHVPVVLDTDDAAILRTNLNQEYLHAVMDYQLDYPTLKDFARNSLKYSFLPGKNLFSEPACQKALLNQTKPNAVCQKLLTHSDKAQQQWQLERAFQRFEQQFIAP